jgi:HEAT repeat protein
MRKLTLLGLAVVIVGCGKGKSEDYTVPNLIKTLKHEDPKMRYHAAKSLGKLGAQAKEAVPALAQALKDDDKDVRMRAAYSLGNIGPEARAAVAALKAALKDPEEEVRKGATYALEKIQGKKGSPRSG